MGGVGAFARNWDEAKKLGIPPLPLEVGADTGRMSGAGGGLGSDVDLNEAFPSFGTKVDGFRVPSAFSAPKIEC